MVCLIKANIIIFLNLYVSYVWNSCVRVVYFAKMFKNKGVNKYKRRLIIIVYETFICMSFVWLFILNVLFLLVSVLVLDFEI